jgi:3-methyladenine DNA glycosylase AlkD
VAVSCTAEDFTERLLALADEERRAEYRRYFKSGDQFAGVRMGQVFALAKECVAMEPVEIAKLLDSPIHEVRAGALSVMDKQGRGRRTTPERRAELYELYLRRHDRINDWDLVDLAAPYVVGAYLAGKPRDVLDELARSADIWRRRTAIVATAFFIRGGETGDTFRIAELLVADPEDLIHKAVGGWVREAGKKDPERLAAFLDRHAATMPRTMLRYAIERLDTERRAYYRGLKSKS